MSKLSPAEHTQLVYEARWASRRLVEAGLGEEVVSSLCWETISILGDVGMRDLVEAELGRACPLPDAVQKLVVDNAARMYLSAERTGGLEQRA